ncbi:hypothetical protein [Sinosporangium siamense]|uniref:hypothetical protein n=1 Tax=Sinosporangium siamense TaxID=1367973 RepID=UPI00194F1E65|nr:hypothetical protein [Sinosporangium siamense]
MKTQARCTDGSWRYLPDVNSLRDASRRGADGPGSLGEARALVRRALDAGGHDNVAVVLLRA